MPSGKILVVEDDQHLALGVSEILTKLGYLALEPVASGEQAIQVVAAQHPDLVLMDIYLPGVVDGIKAAQEIRDLFNVPTIFISGQSDNGTLQRAKEATPYTYLVKPFTTREVHAAVEMALYRSSLEKKERQHMDALQTLAQAAVHFLEIPAEAELLAFTGEQVSNLAPQAIACIVSPVAMVKGTGLYSPFGLSEAEEKVVLSLCSQLCELALTAANSLPVSLNSGKLVQFPGGFQRFAANLQLGYKPQGMENLRNIEDIYAMAIDREGTQFGCVALLVSQGENPGNTEAIETLVNLAAIALQRIHADQALVQSEEDYRKIFENAHDAMLIVDPEELIILESNPCAAETYGYLSQELIGISLGSITGDMSRLRKHLRKAFSKPGQVDFEAIHHRKDGLELYMQMSATPVVYQGRKAVLLVSRDFTQQKLAEVQSDLNTRRISALSRMGQIVTSSLDLGKVLQLVIKEVQPLVGAERVSVLLFEGKNELVFAAVSGAESEELLGMKMPASAGIAGQVIQTGSAFWVGDEASRARVYKVIDRLSGFDTQSLLAAPLLLDEKVIGVIEAVHPDPNGLRSEDLQVLQAAAQWAAIAIGNAQKHDSLQRRLRENQAITKINQALTGTLEIKRVLQLIVEAAHQVIPSVERAVIHLLDEQTQALTPVAVTGLVDMGHAVFHMRPGEGVAGKVIAEGVTIYVSDTSQDARFLPLPNSTYFSSLLVAPVQIGEKRLGTISVQSSLAQAFSADDERLLTMLGVQAGLAIENAHLYSDLQKSLQQEQAMRAKLVHTEKLSAMGRLIASVAHELNNPLQAIQNALYLVKLEERLSPQAREDLQVALREAERMGGLITRLREVYRPVSNEELQYESLNMLVEEVYQLVNTHLRHSNIQFVFQPDPNLPAVPVIRDQMKQVILNLALNAVEAMPGGGRMTIVTGYQPERCGVYLTLQDTGSGIPAEVAAQVFDPFVTTKESGTGLGLTIAHDILQRHNGSIDFESLPGEGTTFKIWVPEGQA
jgi:PAS domain S-box-containing protein